MITIFDGAMGTMLQKAGLPPGDCPEAWNLQHRAAITKIHRTYIEHGAQIIETNTFGANRIKLSHYHRERQVDAINAAAVQAARAAAGPSIRIAGSVGPTGKFIAPLGDLGFDLACDVFEEQIRALDCAGVDMILIETIIDIQEMRAALRAAKKATAKPVICQMSFGDDGRTITGTDPQTAAVVLEAMGADIIGVNCSLGPAQLLPVVEQLAAAARCPISAQPNAGMPKLIGGETVFPMQAAEFGQWAPRLAAAGAAYIGGCCGTTPAHIAAAAQAVKGVAVRTRDEPMPILTLTSRTGSVAIPAGAAPVLIGERINPTGRKKLAADIKEGNFSSVKKEALAQIKAGAHILDVNMGVAGIDQTAAMQKAVEELSLLVAAPLSIDTSDARALEAALKAYPGRALINSVSAEPERLRDFLPLAKQYGAAILCLPLSEKGVPETAEERAELIQTIMDAAYAAGLRRQDFLLDGLVMTAATTSGAETLRALRLYRKRFGCPATMGLSNISYGLPGRPLINSTFLALSLASGLDAPILNPYDPAMRDTLAAAAAIMGHDKNGRRYSLQYGGAAAEPAPPANGDLLEQIRHTVVNGEKEAVAPLIRQALAEGRAPMELTDGALTAAMNEIGAAFSAGRCFLPQVLLAAETMREAFLTIKEVLPAQAGHTIGKVVLATVKGDIHDLGKNIVAALMENNGFQVIDLGKDVSADAIVEAVLSEQADIVGLCALMTTTMPQIDRTVALLKKSGCTAKTIVGGAVVTAEYAAQAGADRYAADGVNAVQIAKELL